MSGELAGFVAAVDRLLSRGHGLFPASGGTGVDTKDGGGPPPPAPPGGGELATGAAAAGDDYQRSQAAASALSDDAGQAADDATAAGQAGRTGAVAVRDTARTQAAAIMPATDQPAGVKLMVSTMDQRLSDMQGQIDTTNAENQLLATRLRQVAAAYGNVGTRGPGGFPMSGFGGMPGGGGGLGGLSGLAAAPASLISSVKPATGGIPGAAAGVVGRSVGGVLPAGSAKGSESGLQKDTILARRAISAAFPQITDIGGVRADSLPWHPQGKAIDCMIPDPLSPQGKALGDQVLRFALGHWKEFNLNHVIWQNTIWNSPDHSEPFGANWGDITQAHRNHVHVATNGGGYPHGGEVYQL